MGGPLEPETLHDGHIHTAGVRCDFVNYTVIPQVRRGVPLFCRAVLCCAALCCAVLGGAVLCCGALWVFRGFEARMSF